MRSDHHWEGGSQFEDAVASKDAPEDISEDAISTPEDAANPANLEDAAASKEAVAKDAAAEVDRAIYHKLSVVLSCEVLYLGYGQRLKWKYVG